MVFLLQLYWCKSILFFRHYAHVKFVPSPCHFAHVTKKFQNNIPSLSIISLRFESKLFIKIICFKFSGMESVLAESFTNSTFDSELQWQNEPKEYSIINGELEVVPDKGSDNWCRTHYDWGIHDNAHFLAISIPDDERTVEITTKVKLFQRALYDQAGLMIRRGPDSWVKCSTEFGKDFDSPARLGSVVTNKGFSDWARL